MRSGTDEAAMFKKNSRVLILAAAMSLGLAACGGDSGGKSSAASAPDDAPSQNPPPNSAPIISGSPPATIAAGSRYSFQPGSFDPDGDVLTFSIKGLPGWASFDPQTGLVSGRPSASDLGTSANIVILVSDGQASDSLPAFQITVVPAPPPPAVPADNVAPTISGTPNTTVQATRTYSFTPSASDANGQNLTFSITNKPSWATFSTSTGRLSGTPSRSQVRTYGNIVISVSDGSLSAALPAFSITVTDPPNNAPTISGSPATAVQATRTYSFTPAANDVDGQALAFSIANKPSWATFITSTGKLTGTPSASQVGTYSNIVISVSDGSLSAALPAFSITVTDNPNTAPTISGTPATSVTAGNAYSFTPSAGDADGDTLAFSITGKPSWATFSTSTGKLSGTPTAAQAGSYLNIVISVSDGQTSTALAAFGITVNPPAAPAGTATLSWTAPTENTDGSALVDLAGFRVYHGTSVNALDEMTQLPGSGSTTHTFNQLASGTHYFAVSAYTTGGVESALSIVGSKTIP
jgi:hypothetical protein